MESWFYDGICPSACCDSSRKPTGSRTLVENFSSWRACGWGIRDVKGHDYAHLSRAHTGGSETGNPAFVIANPIRCKGARILEKVARSHRGVPGEPELEPAPAKFKAAESGLKEVA